MVETPKDSKVVSSLSLDTARKLLTTTHGFNGIRGNFIAVNNFLESLGRIECWYLYKSRVLNNEYMLIPELVKLCLEYVNEALPPPRTTMTKKNKRKQREEIEDG